MSRRWTCNLNVDKTHNLCDNPQEPFGHLFGSAPTPHTAAVADPNRDFCRVC